MDYKEILLKLEMIEAELDDATNIMLNTMPTQMLVYLLMVRSMSCIH